MICKPLFFPLLGRGTKSSLGDDAGGGALPWVGLWGRRGSPTLRPHLLVSPEQRGTKSRLGIHRSREGPAPGHAELHKMGFIFKEIFPCFLSSFLFLFFFSKGFIPPPPQAGFEAWKHFFCIPMVAFQWWEGDFLESCGPPRGKAQGCAPQG